MQVPMSTEIHPASARLVGAPSVMPLRLSVGAAIGAAWAELLAVTLVMFRLLRGLTADPDAE